ncbi:acetylglucosaminyltransferase [Volvox carteri f. nagariensis]|uniref:Acetylglucosaminyltransferase n=1 Tax=Volvox carteri f. nagariensis TaxID=3068 RepID=D8U9S4_VOLCA|nr:acetylglucosaminyltransferase [Volvox carteri f. nagariensis]EFJ43461.1 acetylglucosaminyltransferase [Volvox carteri f. nagariensis]|eukprot:XP_002955390.1 acetylglucosaminyltransferase [Volvox carteri f. nagariensis]
MAHVIAEVAGGPRMQAVQAGCVPVVISDDVLEAFEPFLDWNTFGVRLAEADIPRMHEVREAISPEEYAHKEVLLRCAAQHMAFSTVTGSYIGESGRYDAFETLLEILRAKAAHPDTPPEQLRQVDPQLDAFLDCRDPNDPDVAPAPALAAADGGAVDGKMDRSPLPSDQHQQQQGQRQQPGLELPSISDSDSDSSSRILSSSRRSSSSSGGRNTEEERLCSVSLLDEDDPAGHSCRSISARRMETLFGGYMCIRKPLDPAACPRPWL